jgi:hypothetical protein
MAVGFPTKANWAAGDVLTASAQDDLAGTVNLLSNASASTGQYLVSNAAGTSFVYNNNFAAGKNKIINGDYLVWQRGTSFSNPTSNSYTADRWRIEFDGTGATRTISQQTFTPGTAPVSGYEGTYYYRYAISAAGTGNTSNLVAQRIEDVRTFAGQTATLSFWAKADAARSITPFLGQDFGSGGSSAVYTYGAAQSVTTSWTRFSITFTVPSISGKTIGTSSFLSVFLSLPTNVTETIDIWGVQLETGSVATAFQTATGTIQGELAACQRYYFRASGSSNSDNYGTMSGFGLATGTTNVNLAYQLPVTMRTGATSIDYANLSVYGGGVGGAGFVSVSAASLTRCTPNFAEIILTNGTVTTGAVYRLQNNNSSGSYLGFSAEL